ncbi:MAG: hypothetical protein ABH848_03280 [Candidatus Omnitrophota bacterium]
MIDKKITRRDFLKTGIFGIMALIVAPVMRMFSIKKKDSYKEAQHYKKLAG